MTTISFDVTTTERDDYRESFTSTNELATTEQTEVTSTEDITKETINMEDIITTTEIPGVTIEDSGVYEFDCDVNEDLKGELALNCKKRNQQTPEEKNRVYIIIDKRTVDGDFTRIFDENVRLVVQSVVLEDISPKK